MVLSAQSLALLRELFVDGTYFEKGQMWKSARGQALVILEMSGGFLRRIGGFRNGISMAC